jgi:hypothetical protein
MYRHTTRTDSLIDIADSNVDMGYHYTLTAEIAGDFNFDDFVDFEDFSLFGNQWQNNCTFPFWCYGTDLNEDGKVDLEDLAAFYENWLQTETVPPQPDPMTWKTLPQSAGPNSIAMTATKAIDTTGSPIEYYFDCVSPGCHDRGWDPCSTYTDTGLTNGVQYGYRVRAKDNSGEDPNYNVNDPNDPGTGNKTGWSDIGYAIAGEDLTPPQPDPMTWSTVPDANLSNSISMIATTATDACDVEYFFEELTGNPGANSSPWQNNTVYVDTGLDPNTTYTYRVKARDKTSNHNETQFSDPCSATTLPAGTPGPNEPIVDTTPPTYTPTAYGLWVTPPYSEKTSPPYWYHYMEAVAATDAQSPPVTYYFECVSGSGTSVTTLNSSPLYPASSYPYFSANHSAYRVHIRDAVGNEVVSSTWHTFYGPIP